MATLGGRRFGPLTLGGRPDYQALFPAPKFVPTGSLTATPRTIGGSIEGGIAGALHKFGLSEKRAAQYGKRIMAPLNDVTPVGNVTGAEDGANLFRSGLTQGNLKAMGLGAGVFGLSVLPGPVGKKAGKAAKGMFGNMMRDTSGAIRAWHGSPHDFDRFDMSKIGTGEGAQAYGHGLYFAENKEVADFYRGQLSDTLNSQADRALARNGGDMAAALADSQRKLAHYEGLTPSATVPADTRQRFIDMNRQTIEELHRLKSGKGPRKGVLYEVDINAEPSQLLDFDTPAIHQPRPVQQLLQVPQGRPQFSDPRLERIVNPALRQSDRKTADELALIVDNDQDLYNRAWDYARATLPPKQLKMAEDMGQSVGDYIAGQSAPQLDYLAKQYATGDDLMALYRGREEALRSAGIPGIRYRDAGSRGSFGDTSNYVVFDDSLIDILNKF